MSYYDRRATREMIRFLRNGGAGSVKHLTAQALRSHVYHLTHAYLDDQDEWNAPRYASVDWQQVEEAVGFSSPPEGSRWLFW